MTQRYLLVEGEPSLIAELLACAGALGIAPTLAAKHPGNCCWVLLVGVPRAIRHRRLFFVAVAGLWWRNSTRKLAAVRTVVMQAARATVPLSPQAGGCQEVRLTRGAGPPAGKLELVAAHRSGLSSRRYTTRTVLYCTAMMGFVMEAWVSQVESRCPLTCVRPGVLCYCKDRAVPQAMHQ
jgi:hypothetical protein